MQNLSDIIINQSENETEILPLFELRDTLDCGQAFRWAPVDDSEKTWKGVAFSRVLTIERTDNSIIFHCSKDDFENIWAEYFDLFTDYEEIKYKLSELSPVLKEACEFSPGIRILKQDPWEAICSFIISQNNNIPRIKGIVGRLCENFGEKLEEGFYSFPSAEKISKLCEEDLASIRSGFRAKYILAGANSCLDESFINDVYTLSTDEARKKLMTVKGIGPKVADCALLFGFYRMDAFPVDTWMKKAMAELLPDVDPSVFGNYAGIAQQYIFNYARAKL